VRASASCHDQPVSRSILIVDDHSGFRSLARELLESEGFDVVGEASDGTTALSEAARLHPEVVLLDVQLPDLDGFEVAERLNQGSDPPAVVLVSTREAAAFRRRLAASGARGFISKADLSGHTLSALIP
jgi:DNA-binding NarL/FixJ family response regulator